MKKFYLIFVILLLNSSLLFSQIAINADGSAPDHSAMLDVKSTDRGLLIPRISTLDRNQIPSPATGLMIYNTTTNQFNFYNGSYWYQIETSFISSTIGTLSVRGGVSINASPDVSPENSAMLDINNPTRGILIPRTKPEFIKSPATGLIIYNTDANFLSYYDGGQWITLCAVSTGIAGAVGSQPIIGVANKTDNSSPHHSAMLDVFAPDKGVLIPRLTNAQRDAILPVNGLVIYNISAGRIEFYNGSAWFQLITTCVELPVVTTAAVSDTMASRATSGGIVTSDGGAIVTGRGVCWNTIANPTIANSKTTDGTGLGNFASSLTGLNAKTTYYLRAYATNSAGTAYGNELSFKTAQINIVCGSDSIVLDAENHENGVIEWQESIDSVTWVTIPELSGTTYKFLPTQTKFYRTVVKTSTTEPLPSVITLVQLPPVADAGRDRTIGGTKMTLLGNKVIGAKGEWKIISGEGGVIADPTNQSSEFTGTNNKTYNLVWSLQNLCGHSSDTVAVKFEEIVSKDNFIVVDNTDKILSDSTEMASGTYRIKFSDPDIAPVDSVMLIAMREDISFLRQVMSFTLQDSIYTFNTEQGSFQDLFKSGVLNMGDAVNQGMMQGSSNLKSASIFPTRKTIKNNSDNTGIKLLYVGTKSSDESPRLKSAEVGINTSSTNGTNTEVFTLPLPSIKIFANEDESVTFSIKDAYIKITPKFVLDYSYSFPASLTKLRIGADNGEFEYNFKTEIVATGSHTIVDKKKDLLEVSKHIFFMAGPIPVDVVAKFAIKASCSMDIAASMKLEQTKNYKVNLTAMVEGDNVEDLRLKLNSSATSTYEDNFITQGTISSEFKIGPEISFKAYGIVGPYLNLPAKVNMNLCANTDLNWDANASIGFEGYLGARADIIVKKLLFPKVEINLFDFSYPLFDNAFTKKFKMPYQLELLSGNFQSGVAGQKLAKPISLKVTSSTGFGVPLVPVRFELGSDDGITSQKVLFSDAKGRVDVDWTLGANPKNTLKIRVLDCDNSDIENSPMFIYANATTTTYDCTNSNLTIGLKTTQSNMYPSVSGGTLPYSYSTNGVDYSSTVPQFSISVPGHNTVYVKDKNQCIKTRAFDIKPIDACTTSNLSFDVLLQPNILTITGKNGTAPYTFAVDNTTSFTTTNIYSKLTAGAHTVYIKDGKGCVASKNVTIESQTTAAIKASYPLQGAGSVPVSGITFQWVVANYASNQVYDLSLKKGSEAYSVIASNLNTTSFTYTTALSNSSNYTWKLAIKGSNGAVIDYSEFTFSTASGIATTPTVPVLLQPANGALSVLLPITFKWTAQAGDFKYDLYIDETNATRLIANNLSTPEFTVNTLTSGKKYYWKVRIKNTSTGEFKESAVWSVTPKQNPTGSATDIDGNVYHTVTIGTQVWMVENLKTTRYRTGEAIGTTTPATKDIDSESTPKYQWAHNGDESNVAKYGRLYTWYAVADSRNIAPAGWHVPTDAEWTTLENYLIANGYNYDGTTIGNKIGKSLAATTDWYSNTVTGTIGNDLTKNNTSGFSVLPGGGHFAYGTFDTIGKYGFWWSSTEYNTTNAWSRSLSFQDGGLNRNDYRKSYGFSVRCIRDL